MEVLVQGVERWINGVDCLVDRGVGRRTNRCSKEGRDGEEPRDASRIEDACEEWDMHSRKGINNYLAYLSNVINTLICAHLCLGISRTERRFLAAQPCHARPSSQPVTGQATKHMTIHVRPTSRRDLLKLALAGATVSTLPPLAAAANKAGSAGDGRFTMMMASFAEEMLPLIPTNATSLGLDTGPRATLKSQLEDVSAAGAMRWAHQVKSMSARLDQVDRKALGEQGRIRYDALRYTVECGIEGLAFSFGGAYGGVLGETAPFPVTQQDGAITRIPEFLDASHRIAEKADANAYLDRVEAMARMLDQETGRIVEQAAMGVAPPDFVMRTALGQLRDYRKTPASAQKLVTSIAGRARTLRIDGAWAARASRLVTGTVYPALDRQIAAYARAARTATSVAGVHRLPNGEAYYAWALKLGSTTPFGPEQLHRVGREQNDELDASMDAILRTQGMTQGSVGARMRALSGDPQRLFADDDRGRAQLIGFCNERVADMRKLLPRMSHMRLKAPLMIKRVPADIQDGAALGYMHVGSLDGTRPAIYYINLKSTRLWPRHELATLTAHEGVPGHALHGAYLAEHQAELPLISSIIGYNAFLEGWALYAEQLVDEFGLYESDPFSRLGYFQAQKFRACRLVVDTGIHAMKWTREQAVHFLSANTGRSLEFCTSEIDRYAVLPGQACGYKVGHNEILGNRERARAALGRNFDLASFNDAIIACCGVPMTVLPAVVDQYIASASSRS